MKAWLGWGAIVASPLLGIGAATILGAGGAAPAADRDGPASGSSPDRPATVRPQAAVAASVGAEAAAGRLAAPPHVAAAAAPAGPALVVRRVLALDGPFVHGAWKWDETGAPPGPIVITVDVVAQSLSVFRGGYEIGTAVILYGADDRPTPLGTYPITQKDADHVSNLYGAPMPYMLRLTDDGISIHGSEVSWGVATHGCIGVPVAFARRLFKVAKLGDRVIVTSGRMIGPGDTIAPAA